MPFLKQPVPFRFLIEMQSIFAFHTLLMYHIQCILYIETYGKQSEVIIYEKLRALF